MHAWYVNVFQYKYIYLMDLFKIWHIFFLPKSKLAFAEVKRFNFNLIIQIIEYFSLDF